MIYIIGFAIGCIAVLFWRWSNSMKPFDTTPEPEVTVTSSGHLHISIDKLIASSTAKKQVEAVERIASSERK